MTEISLLGCSETTMTQSTLSGRNALVTGGSRGIGLAIGRSICAAEARVSLMGRSLADASPESLGFTDEESSRVSLIAHDLFQSAATPEAVQKAANTMGGLDILINAAGIARQSSLVNGDSADWRDMFEVNVLALAEVTKAALALFPDTGHGDIINISSMSGHRVPGKGGCYAPTKFAVRAMTEGLRQELRASGSQVRVSCVSPGFVDTLLLDEYFTTGDDGSFQKSDIGYEILQPEDIAELAMHQLCAPDRVDVTDILVRPTGQKT